MNFKATTGCLSISLWLTIAALWTSSMAAQETRVIDQGFNSWYAGTAVARLAPNVDFVGQYHFRRTDFGSQWQQSLLFLGAEWTSPSNMKWSAAYGNIVNFPGGDAKQEHRLFEQVVYAFSAGKWSIGHRHRVEHQWLEQKEFVVRHRYRIDFSATRALNESGTWKFRAHNESIVALFDRSTDVFYQQNWLGIGVVYAFSPTSSLNLEYLNQFIVSGGGWNATSNHTINWMYIHKLDFAKSENG